MTAPLSPALTADRVLILDFGSQVTQLIARRLRESGVYCELHPFTINGEKVKEFDPKAIILSGSPAFISQENSPRAPQQVFEQGVPVLGICYGHHIMCAQLGGEVTGSDHREYGRAFIDVKEPCALFEGLWDEGAREQVWMSHGDRVTKLPEGFRVVAQSEGAPFAVIADDSCTSTACSSIRKSSTLPTARSFCGTSPTMSPGAAASGRWQPSVKRKSGGSGPRSARAR